MLPAPLPQTTRTTHARHSVCRVPSLPCATALHAPQRTVVATSRRRNNNNRTPSTPVRRRQKKQDLAPVQITAPATFSAASSEKKRQSARERHSSVPETQTDAAGRIRGGQVLVCTAGPLGGIAGVTEVHSPSVFYCVIHHGCAQSSVAMAFPPLPLGAPSLG